MHAAGSPLALCSSSFAFILILVPLLLAAVFSLRDVQAYMLVLGYLSELSSHLEFLLVLISL